MLTLYRGENLVALCAQCCETGLQKEYKKSEREEMGPNRDKGAGEKLLALFSLLLFSDRWHSLRDLATYLACSKQTVLRLVDHLEASEYAKVVRAQKGREAIYRLERPRHLPQLSLDAKGLEQLALCRNFLRHLFPVSIKVKGDTVLLQASAYTPPSEQGNRDIFLPYVAATSLGKGRIDYTNFQERLHTLTRAVAGKRVCRVGYKPALHSEVRYYDFAPVRIVAFHEVIYILGWHVPDKGSVLPLYEKPAQLLLHRLHEVGLSRRVWTNLPDPEETPGAFGVMDSDPFRCEVLFSGKAAAYVAERVWSDDQEVRSDEKGNVILAFTARSFHEVLSWVLGFGSSAHVLNPDWMQDAVKIELEKTIHGYNKQ